jgi:hypothetical protein
MIFLDEPTTGDFINFVYLLILYYFYNIKYFKIGLDSATAFNVISLLKDLT